MDIQSVVKGFSTTPFLFVGSGFSRRYYGLPDWEGLLRAFAKRLNNDEFAYNAYLSRANIESSGDGASGSVLARVAELIKIDFDKRWFEDSSFRNLNAKYLEFVHQNQSPFKVEVAQYIDEKSLPVSDKQDELALLKEISKKSLAGIITTNYDQLLEKETDGYTSFVGQEELIFSAIQGWAEIYKIHGSITNPDSIILTERDYSYFADYCPYLASKLMTIFMEYPIIFMGYSLGDPNIRVILESIVKCLSRENLERLQNRFVYVEWEEGKKDIEVASASITIDQKTIRMTSIKTDDFSAIFRALAKKRSAVPVKLIRLFKQELYTYALTNHPTANMRIAGIDDTRIDDEELVLALGKVSTLGLRGLRGLTVNEWYRHIVMHDLEFSADEILENAYPYLIKQANTLPLNMLLHEATKSFPDCAGRVKHSFDDIISKSFRNERDRRFIPHRTVDGIIDDRHGNLNMAMYDIAHLKEDEIDLGQLESMLRRCYVTTGFVEHFKKTSGMLSNFNRLIRIYDWMKYGRS